MRLSKLTKKGVSVALALSMVVAGTAGMTQKASAAKKFKTYVMFSDDKWKVTANMNTAKGEYDSPKTIKAKKGTQNVSMTLTKSKLKTGAKEKTSAASVFCVDIENAMKTYKPSQIKISKVKIYVDGKALVHNYYCINRHKKTQCNNTHIENYRKIRHFFQLLHKSSVLKISILKVIQFK